MKCLLAINSISLPLLTIGFAAAAGSLAVASGNGHHAAQAGGEPAASAGNALLLGDLGGERARLSTLGLDVAVSYVGEGLANPVGGMEQGAIYEGLLKIALDLDTGKLGLWPSGALHTSILYPHGRSLTENYVGDLFTFSNLDAPDTLRLFELWYEHALLSDTVSIRAGLLAADEDFAGTDYGCDFINGTCGWPAIIALNVPSPAYPVGTPGVRLAAELESGWSFKTAIYNGDPYPLDESGNPLNEHGLGIRMRDALVLGEIARAWNLGDSSAELPGRASLGGWYHSGTFEDQRFDTAGYSLADPASNGEPRTSHGNWGVFGTAQQQVTREGGEPDSSQGLGFFTRVGASPSDRNTLEFYAEAGLIYTGLIPGRDADVGGVAMAYGQMSRSLRELARDRNQYEGTDEPLPDYEWVLEASYRAPIGRGITIQPVLALILHPGGSTAVDDALIVGLRTTFDF